MGGFVIYGLGIGMGCYPIIKTTWKYFPEKKGLLTGIILSVSGFFPFIFTAIADAVINPDGEEPNDKGIFIQEYIAIRLRNFSLIMSITMGVCGILSQILMFPLDNIENIDNNQVVVEENDNNSKDVKQSHASNKINNKEKEAPISDNNCEKIDITKDEENNKIFVSEPFMQVFKSLRFHLFNLMFVGTLCKFK